jgi:hypothetical protein
MTAAVMSSRFFSHHEDGLVSADRGTSDVVDVISGATTAIAMGGIFASVRSEGANPMGETADKKDHDDQITTRSIEEG